MTRERIETAYGEDVEIRDEDKEALSLGKIPVILSSTEKDRINYTTIYGTNLSDVVEPGTVYNRVVLEESQIDEYFEWAVDEDKAAELRALWGPLLIVAWKGISVPEELAIDNITDDGVSV